MSPLTATVFPLLGRSSPLGKTTWICFLLSSSIKSSSFPLGNCLPSPHTRGNELVLLSSTFKSLEVDPFAPPIEFSLHAKDNNMIKYISFYINNF